MKLLTKKQWKLESIHNNIKQIMSQEKPKQKHGFSQFKYLLNLGKHKVRIQQQ